jgi:hypothetical protein
MITDMTTNAQAAAAFMQAAVLSTAKSIAKQYMSGDVQGATQRLQSYESELSAADNAAFIGKVQEYIERG